MFERYTEKARRIIFFARYEASQFGSPYIETEYLLLGLLREDKALTSRFISKISSVAAIRRKIENATTIRDKIATSVDLPLSNEAKRVLAYAAEEAERLSHKHIGPEHLFLGLMREEGSFAAQILAEIGLELKTVREELAKAPISETGTADVSSLLASLRRDLTALAAEGRLKAFLGREKEMQQLIQVLGRSARNNVILVGDPGSGRRAMVEGLAQRTAEADAPPFLEHKKVVEFDIDQLRGAARTATEMLLTGSTAIFFMEDLIPLLAGTPPTNFPAGGEILKALLLDGKIQCICSATDEQYRRAREQHGWVDRWFTAIKIPAMNAAEAQRVVELRKGLLESFHDVTFDSSVLSDAVRYSLVLIKDRALPGAAMDLLDEAAAHALTHSPGTPDEIREVQKRIRFIVKRMEDAIANHEFEKARFYSDEERKDREHLRELQKKYKIKEALQVTREDLEEVLAQWTGISVSEVRKKISSLGEESTTS